MWWGARPQAMPSCRRAGSGRMRGVGRSTHPTATIRLDRHDLAHTHARSPPPTRLPGLQGAPRAGASSSTRRPRRCVPTDRASAACAQCSSGSSAANPRNSDSFIRNQPLLHVCGGRALPCRVLSPREAAMTAASPRRWPRAPQPSCGRPSPMQGAGSRGARAAAGGAYCLVVEVVADIYQQSLSFFRRVQGRLHAAAP